MHMHDARGGTEEQCAEAEAEPRRDKRVVPREERREPAARQYGVERERLVRRPQQGRERRDAQRGGVLGGVPRVGGRGRHVGDVLGRLGRALHEAGDLRLDLPSPRLERPGGAQQQRRVAAAVRVRVRCLVRRPITRTAEERAAEEAGAHDRCAARAHRARDPRGKQRGYDRPKVGRAHGARGGGAARRGVGVAQHEQRAADERRRPVPRAGQDELHAHPQEQADVPAAAPPEEHLLKGANGRDALRAGVLQLGDVQLQPAQLKRLGVLAAEAGPLGGHAV